MGGWVGRGVTSFPDKPLSKINTIISIICFLACGSCFEGVMPLQLLIGHNSWVRKETAGIHEDTCLLFTEVYLFVYTLHLETENPPWLQVWLHAKWHCGEGLEGRNLFGNEPRWFTLHNQADVIRCLLPPSTAALRVELIACFRWVR